MKTTLENGWIPFDEFLALVKETRENIRLYVKQRLLYDGFGIKKLPNGRKYKWGNVKHYNDAMRLKDG